MSYTIVITTANEPALACDCIRSLITQSCLPESILVVAPDQETENVCVTQGVRYLKDEGTGKINAMNRALKSINTDVVVWTDGDCIVENIQPLLSSFDDLVVGAAGGRPAPLESRGTKWGFFHHFLTDAAHKARQTRAKKGQYLELSGYLWGFRTKLIEEIPYDTAEDSIVPLMVFKKGYKVAYVPESKVYTKGPVGVDDWIKQKSRTIKSHQKLDKDVRLMKTFRNELIEGMIFTMTYKIRSPQEIAWLVELFPLRLYTWYKSRSMPAYKDGWETVKSTKVQAVGVNNG